MKRFVSRPTLALYFILLICTHRVSAQNEDDSNKEKKEEKSQDVKDGKEEKEEKEEKKENTITIQITAEVRKDENPQPVESAAGGDQSNDGSEPDDTCGLGEDDTCKGPDCKQSTEGTHPEGDVAASMGKCSAHKSKWRDVSQSPGAVNMHHSKITSMINPEAKHRAIAVQQITSIHQDCMESKEGTMSAECSSCSASLNPNRFGVILTCYQCQRGASDRTCHHVIKTSPKLIVSSANFEFVDLSAEENRNQSANRGFPR